MPSFTCSESHEHSNQLSESLLTYQRSGWDDPVIFSLVEELSGALVEPRLAESGGGDSVSSSGSFRLAGYLEKALTV